MNMFKKVICVVMFSILLLSCDTDSPKSEKNIIIGIKKDSFSIDKKSYHLSTFEKEFYNIFPSKNEKYGTVELYLSNNTPIEDVYKVKDVLSKNEIREVRVKVLKRD